MKLSASLKVIILFFLFFGFAKFAQAQTTYTWIGGNGSWAVSTNWTPTRTTPNALDILQFNDGGIYTVTALPATQTIRQLFITNGSDITLQPAATTTLTINGPTLTNNLVIASGATLQLSASNALTLTMTTTVSQRADISGTLNVRSGALTTTGVASNLFTVSPGATVNHVGGAINGSAATLQFSDGSHYYNKSTTTALTVPTATWGNTSTVHFEDITTLTALVGISGQSFGHFIYNCPNQTAAAVTFQITGATTRFKGDFSLLSSGGLTRSINFKNGVAATTVIIDGNLVISSGTLHANIGATVGLTLNLNSNYNQSGGTFILTTALIACNLTVTGDVNLSGGVFDISTQNIACAINFDGNYNQTGGTFQRSNTGVTPATVTFRGISKTYFFNSAGATMDNSRINYQLSAANASLTLLSNFDIPTLRSFTVSNGTLFCADKLVTGAGSFVLTSAAVATLGIGSQDGIQTGGALGNIQTTTARTFGLAANYIYNGTNGQITGNALPLAATGYILIDLQSNSNLITFTGTVFSGSGINLRLRSGALANGITYTNVTSSTLTYEGVAAQTSTNNEFPLVNGPRSLTINNSNGVTLHASRDLPANGILTLTTGILTTTNSTVLSVLNTAAATAVVGGSSTSFVNGPLVRSINAIGVYPFPVGEGSTYGKIIATTQNIAAVSLRATYKNSSSGGSAGVNMSSLNNYYWSLERLAGSVDLGVLVNLTKPGLPANAKIGYSSTVSGAYANIGGTIVVDEITSQLVSTISAANPNAFYSIGNPLSLSGTINTYLNLTEIANALNLNIVVGNTIFQLPVSYAGEPAYPVVFNEFVTDGPLHNVLIRPIAGSTNFLTAGDPGSNNTLIDFNGTDRVTIDGRANSTGTIQWIFRNSRAAATYGSTCRFINGATGNTLTYLQIESQAASALTGTILFSTSTIPLGGNNNNTVSFCNIRENTANSAVYTNGIYSLGTAGAVNSGNQILNNNISNFYLTANTATGVLISTNNTDWTINGNSFYQTTSRVNNGASCNAIYIINTGINYVVKNNFIGGGAPNCSGGALSFTGTGAGTINAIYLNANTSATGCEIENNTIANINWSRGTSSTAVSFIGIRNANGNALIKGNTIGSNISNNSIIITENFVTTPSTCNGIYYDAGAGTIENNTIGGITADAALTTIGNNLYGIFVPGGSPTIQNNTIGSATLSNSLHASAASTHATGQFVTGIQISSSATPITVLNNTIAGLTNACNSAGAASYLRGIATTSAAGIVNCTGNILFNFRNNSALVGTGITANTIGILHQKTTAGQTISQNTIYDIVNTHPTAVVSVTGIHISYPTSGTNLVSRNNIHSLSVSSSNNASNITGINAFAGVATYLNNMIRLGIDASGNPITTGFNIAGIQQSSATASNFFYFNSIYIGGTGVSGNNNSYAYQRLAGTLAINLRNNIFFNERAHSSGTALNYAIGLNASTAVTSNYNIYKTSGSNGRVGLINTTTYAALTDWQNVFVNDVNSLYGPVSFINTTGNAAGVDLHINPLLPSQNESTGSFIATYGDVDDDIRFGEAGYAGTGTAPDIGADEGEFIPADLTAPTIVYTVIPAQAVLTGPVLSATITDASGVNTTAGTRPRLYYKYTGNTNAFNTNTNATNGWKYVESVSIASPFSFTIDYSLLFGGLPVGGETLNYFVVAQDLAATPNVAINSGIFNASPASVALTAAAFPLTGTINSYFINVLSGTVTVGTGGNYLSLTNPGGLFEAINTGALSANLNAQIISDLLAESGTHALNQWAEIGAGNYTLTISPNNNTLRTISGTFGGALIRLNGADRVIVDGRDPSNIPAAGKHLLFVNTTASTAAATIQLLNEAVNNILRYTILRGSTTSATMGVLVFGTSAAGTAGNSNNIVDNCDIHQYTAGLPTNGIYSAGTAGRVNSNNVISNNNIFNFFNVAGNSCGISLASNTSDWTIEYNRFYQDAVRTTTSASTFHYVINVNNTSNANTIIRGNYIGGSAADGSGTMNYTAAVSNQFAPIYLNTNSAVASKTIVENNTITNISFTTISSATAGIGPFTAIYQLAGASKINGNTIGSATLNNAITVTVNTNANGIVNAIRYDGTSTAKIESNTIGGITVNGTGTNNGTNFYAINISVGNVAIKNNLIGSASTSNSIQLNGTATTNASILGAINIVATAAYLDSLFTNSIYNLTNFNGGTGSRIFGISATSGAQYIIESNTIRNLTLTNSTNIGTNSTPAVLGIALSTANTQQLAIIKNTIYSLENSGNASSAFTTGIYYSGGTNSANLIEKNIIHSLSPSTGASASVIGILLAGGTTTNVRNNMLRLGIGSNGTSITQSHNISGILQTANNIHNIFFNSVYIGGAGVTGALNTFAYQRNQASYTTATSLRNNIFVNSRSNGAGTGVHYSIGLPNSTAFISSNYNLFYANGNGGAVGLEIATMHTALTSWKSSTGFDFNSVSGAPGFINATGNAAAVDLHINPLTATQVESAGTAVGVFDDIDNDVRFGGGGYSGTGTAVDLGADEGEFIPQDLTPPLIVYTPIPNQVTLTAPNLIATITDASGVAIGAGVAPRIYFKRSTDANTYINNTSASNGWKYVESVTGSSPFTTSINYNLLFGGSIVGGEIIEYFVIAQDMALPPNVGINSGAFNTYPATVALTAAAFPLSASINTYVINVLSGTVTVGTGGNYLSLTNNGGLFEAINAGVLSGNLNAQIISDLAAESGTHALNEWVETGAGNYTLTIRPDGATQRVITGNYAGGSAALAGIYRFNGADRVVIDGRNPGNLPAGDRNLLFRNTNNTASNFNGTITLINDAKDFQIKYCVIEGATAGTLNGALRISTSAASGTGNDNILIDNCFIRDLSSGAGAPSHGIYALGTVSRTNDNITISNNQIFNFHLASAVQNAAIYIGSYTENCAITSNSIYQTVVHATASYKNGIIIDNSLAGNFTISNNFIGGNSAGANGTWQVNASGQDYRFTGISMSTAISPASLVENNTIRNFNITTGTAFQTQGSTFTGIYGSNGEYTIQNNTIGSLTQTANITIICSSGLNSNLQGIYHNGNGAVNVLNNTIGGIALSNTASSANIVNLYGIRVGSSTISQNITVNNNTIGSLDAPITNATGNVFNAGNTIFTGGIHISNARPTIVNSNQVHHIYYTAGGTSSVAFQVAGIFRSGAAAASNIIQSNTISNIRSNSLFTGTGNNVGLSGIYFVSTANGHNVSSNTIHSIRNTNAASISPHIVGMYYASGSSTSTNAVSSNFIHSLTSATTSTSSTITGLWLNAGASTISNNMIRLGIIGLASQTEGILNGINETAGLNLIYFNSIYIGGTGASNTANTHTFISAVASGARELKNNILFNARNNAGAGKNYAIRIGSAAGLASNYNLLHVSGTNGIIGHNGTDQPSLTAWKAATGLDLNSVASNPVFINPDGDVSTVNLHIQPPPALTPIEAVGIAITGLDSDIDSDVRSSNTPTDLGADAGNFLSLDISPPVITYTPIPNQAICGPAPLVNLLVTVTDAQSGISLLSNLPRLYIRRSVGGAPGNTWGSLAQIAGTFVSGTANASQWQFTIDFTALGVTPLPGNEFEYYIVAQDIAATFNVGYSQSNGVTPVHSTVSTPVLYPNFTLPANGMFNFSNPLTGTVTVGSGGNYPNFNNNTTGLFKAIMDRGLASNLEVLVISNVDEAADYYPLGVVQEFCGSNYTITIKPNAASPYVIQSNTSGANPLINFVGTKRVIIDGSFGGAGKYLTFRQRSTLTCIGSSYPTFYFSGTAASANSEIEIKNCVIEGNNRLTGCIGGGVLNFGNLLSTGLGMNNIKIDNNSIRNRSDLAQTATNTPWYLIQVGDPNSTNIPRSDIQITNNELFNFGESAIQIRQNDFGQGIGNGFIITGNKIYEMFNVPYYQYPLWLEGGTNSHSHVISNNLIGGSASPSPDITGTWLNNNVDGEVQAIYVLVGGSTAAEATSIQGNKIKNFNISGTGWTNFIGIRVEAGRVRIGDVTGNVIGSEDDSQDNIISNGSGGTFLSEDAAVMGIWTQSTYETIIENNLVSGLSTGLGLYCFVDGIAHGSNLYFNGNLYNVQGGRGVIRNNQIKNNRSSSNLQNSTMSNEGMLSLFVYTNSMTNLVEGNLIENNGCNAISARNVRNTGVLLGVFGQIGNHGGVFRKNTIAALANANAGEAGNVAPEINGIAVNYGNWEISNNMISLRNGTTGTHITNRNTSITGIRDGLLNTAGQGAQYLYNTIYIYGQNGGSAPANASYAYLRFAIDYSGPVLSNGAPTTLRNNILINERIGIGNHRAIGNIAASPATGWNSSASNYNFVCNLNTAVTTRWGTTDYTWANWLIQSAGDANSTFKPAAATTVANTQLKPTDLFVSNYLFGNLRISLLNADATNFIDNLGTAVSVTDDIDADTRHLTTPDRGADEFNFCQAPDVTVQPVSQLNICANSNVSYTATYTGLAPVTMQWQVSTNGGTVWSNLSNAGIYSGTTTNTLTLTGVTNGLNNNQYRLRLVNACGLDSSNAATLTITQPPVITLYSPLTFVNTICSGNTSFQVTATGTSLTYQWQVSTDNGGTWNNVTNVAPYSGATTNQLAISNIPPPNLDGNKYKVIITDACSNTVTSNIGTLNVGVANITVQPPVAQIACAASTASIAVTATGSGTTYQWQVSINNGATWNNVSGVDYFNATTNTLGINVNYNLNGNQYRVIVNSSCNVPTTSSVSLLKVQFNGQWLGAGSNWDTPTNWGCGIVPNSTINVVIPTVPEMGFVFPVVSSAGLSQAKDITIETGASLTIQPGNDLSMYGKLINNGTASLGTGTVKFVATTAQQIEGTTISEFGKLQLNNTYTIAPALQVSQHVKVKNELLLTTGKLNLNGYELTIGENAVDGSITGANANSYIIANAAGSLLKRFTTQTGQNYNFPVGDNTWYSPLNLTLTTATLNSSSMMRVKVVAASHPNIGAPIPASYLNRYWTVEPQSITGNLNYNLNYVYNDADVVGVAAIEADLKAYKFNAAGWVAATGSGAQYEMGTANYAPGINQISWTGLSTFSDFTGFGNGSPLPISLLEFNAYPVLEHVELVWSTATEVNNDYFTIERSKDGIHFEYLMKVPGAGNSNQLLNYKETDFNPLEGISYYRLKQTDYDRKFSYSELRVVNFNVPLSGTNIVVFPNPVTANGIYIKNGKLDNNQIELKLTDMLGQVIQENKLQVNTVGDANFIQFNQQLSVGVYQLQIINNEHVEVVKLIVK